MKPVSDIRLLLWMHNIPKILSAVFFCVIIGVVMFHVPGWCKKGDAILQNSVEASASLKEATKQLPPTLAAIKISAEISKQSSDELLDLVGTVNQTFADINKNLLPQFMQVLVKVGGKDGTLDNVNGLVAHINDDVTKSEKPLTESMRKADKLIEAYTSMPQHLNGAVDNAGTLLNTLNDFAADKRTAQLRERATELFASSTLFLNSGTYFINDVDRWAFPVYTGKHPKWNAAGHYGLSLLNLGTKTAPGIYYGIGAWKGQ